jgi:hypothetical protein
MKVDGEATFSPPMVICPRSSRSMPAISRSSVVLPQPDGPSRQMISPGAMSKLTLLTAWVVPKL